MGWSAGRRPALFATASFVTFSLCCALLLAGNGYPAPPWTALVGEYDGGAMSKGLAVQAHDLGWDGGQAYRSSGVTYSGQGPHDAWRQLTTAPPAYAYRNSVGAAYGNAVPAYSNAPWAQRGYRRQSEYDEERGNAWLRDQMTVGPTVRSDGRGGDGLQSAINTGLKAAWDHLAGVAGGNGCDAACLKDIYRRAFRAHKAHREETASPQARRDSPEKSDRLLFGQVPSKINVSPKTFSRAYGDVSSIAVKAAPNVLAVLSNYLPQAVSAEKQLARALAERLYGKRGRNAYRDMAARAADEEHHPQFQYKLKLNDEFDARAQHHLRRFVEEDDDEDEDGNAGGGREGEGAKKEADEDAGGWHVLVDETTHQPVEEAPVLACGEGDKKEEGTWGKLDRMDDCNFGEGDQDTQKYYNRMFYLDREKSGHPASARLVHNHMLGVKKLVDNWKPLLVGAGGGSGEPGAYDDPYYFCYDQYQEDPEFSQCLRDLSEHSKSFSIRKWARPALAGPGDGDAPVRPGFPHLREEWEKELEDHPTDPSKGPPSIEPEGGPDSFEDYY